MKTVEAVLFVTKRLHTRCDQVRSCNRFLKWTTGGASRWFIVVVVSDACSEMGCVWPQVIEINWHALKRGPQLRRGGRKCRKIRRKMHCIIKRRSDVKLVHAAADTGFKGEGGGRRSGWVWGGCYSQTSLGFGSGSLLFFQLEK